MARSATDVMQTVIFSAVMDAIVALKAASRGLPNALARDIGAIHPNTAFADLPKEMQAAIEESVRTAFQKLKQEGYTVGTGLPEQRAPFPPRPPRNASAPTVETKRRPTNRPGGTDGRRGPPRPKN